MSQPDQLDKAALEARKFSISDDELAGMKEDNMSLVDIKTVLVNRAINEAGFQRCASCACVSPHSHTSIADISSSCSSSVVTAISSTLCSLRPSGLFSPLYSKS